MPPIHALPSVMFGLLASDQVVVLASIPST